MKRLLLIPFVIFTIAEAQVPRHLKNPYIMADTLVAGSVFQLTDSTDLSGPGLVAGDTLASRAYARSVGIDLGTAFNATYITQTPSSILTAEQALSALSTGLMKSTTGTGIISIAVPGTDYVLPASPTFTGTVTIPTPFTLGAVSVTASGTELNYVDGVTSAIQTQLDGKVDLTETQQVRLSNTANDYFGDTLRTATVFGAVTDSGGQVFNVKAYGLIGDGSTDNSTALQTMVSALGDSVAIYFPSGIYLFETEINMIGKDGLTIFGAGAGSVLRVAANADVHEILDLRWNTDLTIRDIAFDGNYENAGVSTHNRVGFDISGSRNVRVENVWARGSYLGANIIAWSVINTVFDNVKVYETREGSDQHGIDIDYIHADSASRDVTISNSFFWDIYGVLKFEDVTGMKFINNTVTAWTGRDALAVGEDVNLAQGLYPVHKEIHIEGNTFYGSIVLGNPTPNPLVVRFIDNRVYGKFRYVTNSFFKLLDIQGNTFDLQDSSSVNIVFNVAKAGTAIRFIDNTVQNGQSATTAMQVLRSDTTSVEITDNLFRQIKQTALSFRQNGGIIKNNRFENDQVYSATSSAIALDHNPSSTSKTQGVIIEGNYINDYGRSILMSGVDNCVVSWNVITGRSVVNQNAIWIEKFGDSVSTNNRVEFNRIYKRNAGKKVVNDTGTTGTREFYNFDENGVIDSRLITITGTALASNDTLTIGFSGNHFSITGTDSLKWISTSGWQSGQEVVFQFASTPVIVSGASSPPSGTAAIVLASSTNKTASANMMLRLLYDGTVWRQSGAYVEF